MQCPFCRRKTTQVTNSRDTKDSSQTWRRRKCSFCKEIFTTYEVIDLSYLIVIKKSGNSEVFDRTKLFSGIYGATIGLRIEQREKLVDKITKEVENEILFLKKKKVDSKEIGEIVLRKLVKEDMQTFLRFLARFKAIKSAPQLKKELARYL